MATRTPCGCRRNAARPHQNSFVDRRDLGRETAYLPIEQRERAAKNTENPCSTAGLEIGAPGFEPATSPTLITCTHRTPDTKALQMAYSAYSAAGRPSSRIHGFCGRFRWIGHTTRVCARSGLKGWRRLGPNRGGILQCCRPSGRPGPEQAGDHARGRPSPVGQPLNGLSPATTGVCARPVVRRQQPPVPVEPLPHRPEYSLPHPALLHRAGMASLAVGVRVALPVARLGVRAAPTADPDVARLDGPRFLPRGVLAW